VSVCSIPHPPPTHTHTQVILQLFDQAVSYGTIDMTPWLSLLLPQLEAMKRGDAACYAQASGATLVEELQDHSGRLLHVIAAL
jgi:hypothetical protein